MSRAIIIGYGNPSRCDDSVGHYIVEKAMDAAGDGVDCHVCHQLGIELAETIKDYDLVVFVDAHAGKFQEELRVAHVQAAYSSSAFTHSLNSGSLIALTKTLYQHEPRALSVSVRGHDFSFGTGLSAETQKWASMAVVRILEIMEGRDH